MCGVVDWLLSATVELGEGISLGLGEWSGGRLYRTPARFLNSFPIILSRSVSLRFCSKRCRG